jgi:hypothetical protein
MKLAKIKFAGLSKSFSLKKSENLSFIRFLQTIKLISLYTKKEKSEGLSLII